jgi:arginine decarboxylase
MLAIALHDDPQGVIVCNGYKDRDYIETALFARRLGTPIFLVIEKLAELPLILDVAKRMQVEPLVGIRLRLSTRGKGRWEGSGGDRSKFGLVCEDIMAGLQLLKRRRMLHALQLLHWHLGSQISDIQSIKEALKEAATFFVEICRMGAPISFVDVGGGLAVDYDGSHTNFASSANYGPREYAADVVSVFGSACDEAGFPHPTIVTETGRALVAHHSVLVVEAIGATHPGAHVPDRLPGARAPEVLRRMAEIFKDFTGKNCQETFHDVLEAKKDALMLFNLRHLSLEHRAQTEQYFWATCRKIRDYVRQLEYVPDEMAGIERLLSSTYYCNFSLFQSLPDHWAIKQLFPVVPMHRLDEKPTERGILADITCDSDGVMDQFVDLRDVQDTLPLHRLQPGDPYYLGVFLVGAYQEILGDLHNLFGDTNVVHVSVGSSGYSVDKAVEGESIADVLGYIRFDRRDVLSRMRQRVETALGRGAMSLGDIAPFMKKVELSLDDYTYFRAAGVNL